MRTSAAGSELEGSRDALAGAGAVAPRRAWISPGGGGFTLIELLVVVAIIGISAAGVMGSIERAADAPLEREAMRLAALLEAARAQARVSGQAVRWQVTEEGFRFEGAGLGSERPTTHWLAGNVRVEPPSVWLGPEPLMHPQAITVTSADHPQRRWRIATDGLQPFEAVEAGSP